jgi:hypothetical protein
MQNSPYATAKAHRPMRQNKTPQHRLHERINAALQKSVNPHLESAAQCELRSKNFVLAENQEKRTLANAEKRQRACVAILLLRERHNRMRMIPLSTPTIGVCSGGRRLELELHYDSGFVRIVIKMRSDLANYKA